MLNYTAKYGLTLRLFTALCIAGIAGFLVGHSAQGPSSPVVIVPASYQAPSAAIVKRQNAQLGRIKAEIIALQVLFAELADVANLDDGEFDLDADPLSFVEHTEPSGKIDLLIDQIDHMNIEASVLEKIYTERSIAHNHRISGSPLSEGTRSSGYGYRRDPITGNQALHRGVDFIAQVGTPIHSLADGIVSFAGTNGDYGNLVEIDHGAGYRTRYAHNQANLVAVGEYVSKEQIIATLGSTGKSTGAHVHVEVRYQGRTVDPGIFIR